MRSVERVTHNDYRQQPITSYEAREQYCRYLARLAAMIADQEDTVRHIRMTGDSTRLASARTSLWRLLTKRQGVVDALADYDHQRRSARQSV